MSSVLLLSGVSRVHGEGAAAVHALAGIDLDVAAGELVAVMGPSGSGKSTLLTLAGGLDSPTAGTIAVEGIVLAELSRAALAAVRRRSIGYVFQDFNLIPALTAAENVALPRELDCVSARQARGLALEALEEVGIAELADRFPDDMSGGQQQRVAIARAIVGDRRLVLADEPTGALDTETGEQVMRLLRARCDAGAAGVLVTHEARQQEPDPTVGMTSTGEDGDPAPLRSLVPDGLRILEERSGSVQTTTRGGVGTVGWSEVAAGDPAFRGRFVSLEGRAARGPGEVAVTPQLLERLGVEVGDEIKLTRPARAVRVTGVIDEPLAPSSETFYAPPRHAQPRGRTAGRRRAALPRRLAAGHVGRGARTQRAWRGRVLAQRRARPAAAQRRAVLRRGRRLGRRRGPGGVHRRGAGDRTRDARGRAAGGRGLRGRRAPAGPLAGADRRLRRRAAPPAPRRARRRARARRRRSADGCAGRDRGRGRRGADPGRPHGHGDGTSRPASARDRRDRAARHGHGIAGRGAARAPGRTPGPAAGADRPARQRPHAAQGAAARRAGRLRRRGGLGGRERARALLLDGAQRGCGADRRRRGADPARADRMQPGDHRRIRALGAPAPARPAPGAARRRPPSRPQCAGDGSRAHRRRREHRAGAVHQRRRRSGPACVLADVAAEHGRRDAVLVRGRPGSCTRVASGRIRPAADPRARHVQVARARRDHRRGGAAPRDRAGRRAARAHAAAARDLPRRARRHHPCRL